MTAKNSVAGSHEWLPEHRATVAATPSTSSHWMRLSRQAGGFAVTGAVWLVLLALLPALLPALWGWHPILIYGGSMGGRCPQGA